VYTYIYTHIYIHGFFFLDDSNVQVLGFMNINVCTDIQIAALASLTIHLLHYAAIDFHILLLFTRIVLHARTQMHSDMHAQL